MEGSNLEYIAWWGAGLSTFLAIIKVYELWRSRFRIDVAHGFTGDINVGNDIHIRNISDKPIIIGYWELVYRNKWWFFNEKVIASPGADAYDLKIDSHSSKTFNFSGMDHFSWSGKSMKGRRICIRLYIAGKKPILKRVYG